MANDYDVIYIDDDGRNARPIVQDNRTRPGAIGIRPAGVVVPPSTRPTVVRTASPVRTAAPVYSPAPVYNPAPYYPQPAAVYYHQPVGSGLAGMTTAELLEIGAQVLAALQPLPTAPVAQGDVETDVENLVIYQGALATHAKRDEQLRTIGNLLGRFLRK